MAYEIDHAPDADYHLLQFQGPRDLLEQLQRTLRITDGVTALPDHQAPRRARPPPPDLRQSAQVAEPPDGRRGGLRARRRLNPPPAAVAVALSDARASPRDCANSAAQSTPVRTRSRPDPASRLAGHQRRSRRRDIVRPRKEHGHGRHQHQPGRHHRATSPRDPELRSLPSGTSVCKLRVAVNTRRKDSAPASGSTSPTTSTSPSGARRARTAPATSPRAARVAIDGRLEWREWEGKDGTSARRSTSSPTPCSSSAAAGEGGGGRGGASRRSPTSRSTPATSPPAPARRPARPADDDIPF